MDVEATRELGDGHKIEVGNSTWAPEERSVRDRYPTVNGGFNPRSSPEVPMRDLVPLLTFVAERDELTIEECSSIISVLAASINRQAR